MARAKAGSWIKLVAGLVVGAAAQPLFTAVVPVAVSGSALVADPIPGRPSQVHEDLNNAIEAHRRGEYETAALLFKDVFQQLSNLTDTEKREFAHFWDENTAALDARQKGHQHLILADRALIEDRTSDAHDLLKKIIPSEQFLTPADKAKFKELYARVNGAPPETQPPAPAKLAVPPAAPVPATPPSTPAPIVKPLPNSVLSGKVLETNGSTPAKPDVGQAHAKVQQARIQLNQFNIDAAEKLAIEAEALNTTYSATEDTPAKVLKDVAKAREDAKTMLTAARTAMGRQDFAAAERYAKQSEKVAGTFTFPLWGDSPAKVLKELQAIQEPKKPTVPVAHIDEPANPVKQTSLTTPQAQPVPVAPATPAPSPTTTTSAKPATPPQTSTADTEKARQLVKQGRKALDENKLAQAKDLANQAKALKPLLEWSEDTPEKLLHDIGVAEAKAKPPATTPAKADKVVQASGVQPAAPPAKPEQKLPTTKEEAAALVKKARVQLADGKFDEAQNSAMKARAAKNLSWGLFEDSPDSVLKDIEKARVKHDQEESVKVLAEGRKLLEKGDWEGAQRMAFRAQKLHGPYSIWDFGDRPEKLLADAQELRSKPRKPDTAVVKKDDKKPDTPPTPPTPTVKTPTPATPATTVAQAPATTVAQAPAAKATSSAPPKADTGIQPVSTLPPLPLPAAPTPAAPTPAAPTPAAPTPATQPNVPPPPPAPVVDAHVEALHTLADARKAIKDGDLVKAKKLVDQVAVKRIQFLPGEDCPAAVYQEIERSSHANAPVATAPPSGLQPVQHVQPAVDPNKAKALALLAEGRQLQKDGKLIEAQQKCLLALETGAAFSREDSDNPADAVQQITLMARQRIEALCAQASDLAAYGTGDAMVRYQKAEQMLQEAHYLAQYLALDTANVDGKLAWIRELRGPAAGTNNGQPGNPPAVAPSQPQSMGPTASPEMVLQGRKLLDNARDELKAGAVAQARKTAMEAMDQRYGVVTEAQAVLRTIDNEEFNLKVREIQHTFDAAVSAFNKREYERASMLIGAIDTHYLDESRQAKLKEMLQTPGMMIMRTEFVANSDPSSGGPELQPGAPSGNPSNPPGRAVATDSGSPENDILKNTASMRNVLFTKLRKEGMDAQSTALEKYRAGQTDEAMTVLSDYLEHLDQVKDLDAGQIAQLRHPVEARLQNLKLIKVQDDLGKEDSKLAHKKMDDRNAERLAQESKQKKIEDLMKECTALVNDGKLDDAYRLAMVIKQMDPDNAAATAMAKVLERKRNLDTAQAIKKDNAEYFLDALNDTDVHGKYLSNDEPESINLKRLKIAQQRKSLDQMIQRKSQAMIAMESKLLTPVNINFKDVPLNQAIENLREIYGVNFFIDQASLDRVPLSIDHPVTVRLEGVSLKTAVEYLLRGLNLSYIVRERVVEVTTKENAKGLLVRMTYQVLDLVTPIDNYGPPPGTPMLNGGSVPLPPQKPQPQTPYAPTPLMPPYSMGTNTGDLTGQPMGQPPSNNGATRSGTGTASNPLVTKLHVQTREDALIKLITNSIEPLSWSDMGGNGTIDYFPMTSTLVVNQTLDIQEQVQDLLAALRRLMDQEVAIEVRMIDVDEDYYERIGVDFSMNILTNSRNLQYQPALLNSQFAPNNFINAPNSTLNGLLAGINPAGELTPDLGIPISPNSYSVATPPFGGYQGSGVGGLALGLAFLSDIQVYLFLEAVAGDVRSSVSQAPRITLQNGEIGTISINDTLLNQLAGVEFDQLPNGSFVLAPTLGQIPVNSTTLSLQAVISADRRFVRLEGLNLNLQNSVSNTPFPTSPILVPIYPIPPGTGISEGPVIYSQYITQPRIANVSITTSVMVPDGGTVVLGGLKRMSEGRNEYGPPVLSQIPYLDRLFRNVAYGRSGTSILLMVTPRIIIQEEEEERATGFVVPERAGQ